VHSGCSRKAGKTSERIFPNTRGGGGGKHGIPEGRGNTAGMYVWEGHLEVRARARLTRCIPEGRGTAAGT